MKPTLSASTKLCMSLSARPGNFGTRFHNHLYDALSLDYVYKAFSTADLAAAIGGIRALGIRGCAISMPFKEAVIPLLDTLGPSAAAIDSVNTIVNDDGLLSGHNTDYGAVRTLVEAPPRTPFVVRGSGGMAKAVVAALRDAGFTEGTIVARNEEKGRALAERYGFSWRTEAVAAPLLVNVTPLGMGDDTLAFTRDLVAACDTAFDVVALPVETPFVVAARAAGKRVVTGDRVLVLQGVEQFVRYTGVTPSDAQIAAAARAARG